MNPKWFLYIRLAAVLVGLMVASQLSDDIFHLFERSSEGHLEMAFFGAALIFALSFGIFYLSRGIVLPSFVVAIFFGMAAKPLLAPIMSENTVLGGLVGFGATLILFGGGLETHFESFKRLLPRVLSLSFPGLLLSAMALSLVVFWLGALFGQTISVTAAILIGAILVSTDPASIVPILQRLRFKQLDTKTLIISESAVTDVTGTLLTVVFLSILVTSGSIGASILDGYRLIFTAETGWFLLKQLVFGTMFGLLGYILLAILTRFKSEHDREYEADSAFFLFIPIIIFTFALAFGGSGYLAAFIAGLLFVMSEHLRETEQFFNHIIDAFFKPTIFLILGALVDLDALVAYAGIGLLCSAIFILVIRPLFVFLSLGIFEFFQGSKLLSWRDMMFISFVRETGAIPAVLLVTIAALNLPGMEGLLPIGMWVILTTLIVLPPLTPWVANVLGVAEVIPEDQPNLESPARRPYIVLGTRGESFKRRLPIVAEWAVQHRIARIVVMLCLEYKYQPELEQRIQSEAEQVFVKLREQMTSKGQQPIDFHFFSSAGFLQENIDYLGKTDHNVVAIFVGRKMLDFRLDEVKKLSVPIQFME